MSALWEGPATPPSAPARPRLRPVTAPKRRLARFPFLLVLMGTFGVGMAGLLMLNTTLQNQAFQARALHRQATELAYVQADLERQLDASGAPQELARQASKLGMRPNPHPAFLVLPEGRVVGEPKPVTGLEQQVFVVRTPEQLAAAEAKKAARAKAEAAAKKAAEKAAAAKKKAADQQQKKDRQKLTASEQDED